MTVEILRRKTLLCYGLGSFAPTAVYEFCGLFLLKFYTDFVRLDPIWIGYAFLLRMILDAVVDPGIGYLSDRTRLRAGRRRPYFLIGSLPGTLLFWLVLACPAGSIGLQFSFLTIVSSLMVVCLSLTVIPHMAMSFEITTDYDERVRVVGYRSVIETIASLFALFSVPIFLGLADSRVFGAQLTRADCYRLAGGALGLVCLVTAFVSYLGTREEPRTARECRYDFRTGVLAAMRNRPFLILLAVYALITVANRVPAAQLFIVLEHFHGKQEEQTTPLLCSFYLGSLGSIAIWIYLGRRLGKNRMLRIALGGWPLTYVALVSYRWPDVGLCVVGIFMGSFISGVLTMIGAIAPDVLDLDRSESGLRREGMYASVANVVVQAGLGLGYLVTGIAMHVTGYQGGVKPTEEVVTGLRLSVASFPVVLGITALAIFALFPITKQSHEVLMGELSAVQTAE